MNESREMTSKQKKELGKQEFQRKFGRYWLIYLALGFTAILSFIGGLMLPFMKPDVNVPLTWGTAMAGLFYALGFVIIGEGAANFWFERVTDQDPDNDTQKWIAGVMIAASVAISASTALATSYIIAYWVGVFDAFLAIPVWAQKYIAIAVPVMMVAHAVAGIVFKSVSDEAYADREANAEVNRARNEMAEARAKARASWWKENAPALARQMGEMEAEDELDAMRAKLAEQRTKRQVSRPAASFSQDVRQPEHMFGENGNGAADPSRRRS